VPVEDADVSTFLEKALVKQGMKILTGAGVQKLDIGATGVTVAIKARDGKLVSDEYSHVIVAIGIVPNTETVGLEALG
ncbi:FAD-dependent oxidoreductase, partial [Staphylococcus aureus]